MKTIIVGGGKIGYYLAKTLSENDYDISIIEVDRNTSQYFANTFDAAVVRGDGTNAKVLEKAGAKNCETLIAVTGRDEVNLVVCQLAKKLYNVKKTIAKVNNPKNVSALKKLGVDIAISSTDNIIKLMEREVDTSRIKELIPLNDGKAAVFEVVLPENYVYSHKLIKHITLPNDCNIVSITRGKDFIVPRGDTEIKSNDILLIVCMQNVAADVRRILKIKN